MFKNLILYRLLPEWTISAEQLQERLSQHGLPEAGLEMQQFGWVPPRKGGELCVTSGGDQLLFALRAQKRLLPSTVVKQVAADRIDEITEQQGYRVGKKQRKEITDRVHDELLPKAFLVHRDTQVWIDLKNRWMAIDTATSSKADEVVGFLAKCVDPFPIQNLHVAQPPASAMTGWLAEDEAPANFSIDQDTELRSSGESGAAIRYVKHSIDADDARRHIQSGKQCTRLAMTWADRISFVLTENFVLKSIRPLDVLRENQEQADNEEERFLSNFTLMSGEYNRMLTELIDAHGGARD
ncbi:MULTISPECIES: recombination-associated protein RdgC [Achromobacter]|uniref:Recombination-associated protein RdgC n=1 Tax=Achromobacter mucicolens TaxID=1389922 RepID=A0ABM8LK86_9BURK|nr:MULTISPECIES: recombination-associated protein RdgC [Achromobacter]AVG43869.1 recombination-associated protein RdgC [Achromobacter insolitus]CAB3845918.1 Recombination-associated protein RdgC [Achromobacter aegrifaciens]CAB3914098.1 Recombination-associated protein RdgC [Achromobacter mucicolens]